MLKKISFSTPLLLALLVAAYGCSDTATETPVPAANEMGAAGSDEGYMDHETMDHDHAAHEHVDGDGDDATAEMTDMEKMEVTLAKMSPEDRESAMKQHFCPISGEMLGTMGMPEKIEVEGQTVWICCEACEDQVRADPEKYLAKLDKSE